MPTSLALTMAHPLQRQQFRCNNETAVLAARRDLFAGEFYSDIEGIQDEFPGINTSKLVVDGISVLFSTKFRMAVGTRHNSCPCRFAKERGP